MSVSPDPVAPARRRTQAERSSAMRERLLAAAIASLAEDGYAASTLNSIVRRAGVSRGAQVHHYASKQALMLDVAEDLLRKAYGPLGDAVLDIRGDHHDRLDALVAMLWERIYSTPTFSAYLELQASGRRDPLLAEALKKFWQWTEALFDPAIEHYFAPLPGVSPETVRELFYQLNYLMTGLVAQRDDGNTAIAASQLALWKREARALMRAREIELPPPRPANWQPPQGSEHCANGV